MLFSQNNLADASSPYLLQHKDNPVEWHMWNKETLAKAKKENKLIFLSIGYSTCHWCHVMAQESFENEEVAKLLNKHFISIKVDREELPHIDSHYQKIHNIISGKHGGWPLSIFMSSDQKPILIGTYIPIIASYGSRGLIEILSSLSNLSQKELAQQVNFVQNKIDHAAKQNQTKAPLNMQMIDKTINQYKTYFDFTNKGFSTSPKFPQFANHLQLLKFYEVSKNKEALFLSNSTLEAMANGGIYDQIDGAFYRYTIGTKWQIPHFEKMLYTSGEALETYMLAYKLTNNTHYKKIVQETIKETDKRFQKEGLYLSASNAQSPNEFGVQQEGYYFLLGVCRTHLIEAKNSAFESGF